MQPDDTVLGGSLTLAVVAQLLAAVLGALLISGEYGSGSIYATFAACPRRGTVLAAKAVLIAALMSGLALLSCTAAYWVGRIMLPSGQYARGEAMPALVGVAGSFAVAGLLGLAIGALVRHTAGAVTTVIAVILLPDLIAPLFGDAQRWIAGISPAAALLKLSQSSDATAETVGSLGPWPSLWLVSGYTLAALLAAGWLLRHRDT